MNFSTTSYNISHTNTLQPASHTSVKPIRISVLSGSDITVSELYTTRFLTHSNITIYFVCFIYLLTYYRDKPTVLAVLLTVVVANSVSSPSRVGGGVVAMEGKARQ